MKPVDSRESRHDGMPLWEYEFVQLEQVNEYAALGWRIVPVDPVIEVTTTLGQVSGQILKFTMERGRPPGAECRCGSDPRHTVNGHLLVP